MPSSVVSAHEMFEGGLNAMTFIESGPSACSGQKCRAEFKLSPGTSSEWHRSMQPLNHGNMH
jgi:hypothetical protein